jgi:hypothetical protein
LVAQSCVFAHDLGGGAPPPHHHGFYEAGALCFKKPQKPSDFRSSLLNNAAK